MDNTQLSTQLLADLNALNLNPANGLPQQDSLLTYSQTSGRFRYGSDDTIDVDRIVFMSLHMGRKIIVETDAEQPATFFLEEADFMNNKVLIEDQLAKLNANNMESSVKASFTAAVMIHVAENGGNYKWKQALLVLNGAMLPWKVVANLYAAMSDLGDNSISSVSFSVIPKSDTTKITSKAKKKASTINIPGFADMQPTDIEVLTFLMKKDADGVPNIKTIIERTTASRKNYYTTFEQLNTRKMLPLIDVEDKPLHVLN